MPIPFPVYSPVRTFVAAQGQANAETGPIANPALHLYPAPSPAHLLVQQAEAYTFISGLGGEAPLEEPVDIFIADPDSRILHLDHHLPVIRVD